MPVTLNGSTSGQVTLTATAVAGTNTLTLPAVTGTIPVPTTTPAQGDIMYYNGSNWVNLTAGTAGQVLETGGSGANPVWASTSNWVHVETRSVNSSSDQTFANLGSYQALRITLVRMVPASNNTISLRLSADNGSTTISGANSFAWSGARYAATNPATVSNTDTNGFALLNGSVGSADAGGFNAEVRLYNFNVAATTSFFVNSNSGSNTWYAASGYQTSATALNAIVVRLNSVSTTGTIILEGLL